MTAGSGWSRLFGAAFRQSRNAMTLVGEDRRHVDVNGAYLALTGYTADDLLGAPVYAIVADGPLLSRKEWALALAERQFTGAVDIVCKDGRQVTVQWGAETEIITGRRLVLFVALGSSPRRLGFAPAGAHEPEPRALTAREREIVRFVALGYSGPEIADELHVAHDTVRTHVRNAMAKTGTRSRAHLVAKALGDGLVLD